MEPVLIGHVAPLSGPARATGEHARQGILLAVEEHNHDIDSTVDPPVTVLHADSRGEESGPVATRLISVNGVAALLGGSTPAEIGSLAAAARPYNVPLVAPASYDGAASDPYIFPTGLTPAFRGAILARFAIEELKAKRTLVATNGNDERPVLDRAQSQATSAAFVESFRRAGGEIGIEFTYKGPEELKRAAMKAPADKGAVILLSGVAEDVPVLRSAGLEERLSVLFAGPDGTATKLKATASGRGVYLVSAFANGATPEATAFSKKYQARFGEPPDADAGLAYDSARLLFDAIRRTKGGEDGRLRQALEEVKDFPTLGGPLSWEEGRQASRPGFVVHGDKGGVNPLKTYGPQGAPPVKHAPPVSLADHRRALYAAGW